MSSLNRAELIGNLGADPEVRYTASGKAVATISVATSEKWTDKETNEKKEVTEWHRVTFFDRLAEIAGEYLNKGSKVFVAGKIQTDKYTDKDGVERYATKIIARELVMLSSNDGGGSSGSRAPAEDRRGSRSSEPASEGASRGQAQKDAEFSEDSIPFN